MVMGANVTDNHICPPYFDGFLQWPAGHLNEWSELPCPFNPPVLVLKGLSRRFCHKSGFWTDMNANPVENISNSYTDYEQCTAGMGRFAEYVEHDNAKFHLMVGTIWAGFGLLGSICTVISLILAIWILQTYTSLHNFRTRVNRQLFIAFLIESIAQCVLTSMVLYDITHIDKQDEGNSSDSDIASNIDIYFSPPVMIHAFFHNVMVVIWEFGQSSVFFWTFIEAVHIHNIIVVTVFPGNLGMKRFTIFAWLSSTLVTVIWLSLWLQHARPLLLWGMYAFHWTYLIMNYCRLVVLLINAIFLSNVIRVFVKRLRANDTPEIQQLKKGTKAALLLMPLLGITNFTVLIQEPVDRVGFVIVNGMKRLLPCWQGFLVTVLYCFMNQQVRRQIRRSIYKFKVRHCMKRDETTRNSACVSLTRFNNGGTQRQNFPIDL